VAGLNDGHLLDDQTIVGIRPPRVVPGRLARRGPHELERDAQFIIMLATVAMTGQGEALGMVVYDGRWHIAPT